MRWILVPDLLTHYAFSLLLASRQIRLRQAILIAIIGILPDVDVLLRIHRWLTHSLIITLIPMLIAVILSKKYRPKLQKHLTLVSTIYTLHIVMDIFTAPTPFLWPIVDQAYMLNIRLSSIVSQNNIAIASQISVYSEIIDFIPQPLTGGPLISATGVIVAIGTVTMILIEYISKKKQ